jgi:biopolymer transport protein ExbD
MRQSKVVTAPLMVRINVTPIIDVALVLVIILLVTAPILSVTDLPVELPAAHARGPEDAQRLHLTLAGDGRLALEDFLVAPGQLETVLRRRLEGQGETTLLVVRADAGARHEQVREVLEICRDAGAKRVAVATVQKGEGS